MTLWFLRLFPAFRELERSAAIQEKRIRRVRRELATVTAERDEARQQAADMLNRYQGEAEEHKADLKRTADTFSKHVTGRYTFARASDAEMPAVVADPPQPMASRILGRDIAARQTTEFFRKLRGEINAGTDHGTANDAA